MRSWFVALLSLLFATLPAFAHSGAAPAPAAPAEEPRPVFKLEKLTDRAWCLFGRGGNVGFLVTDVGVVVVDDQYEEVAQGIVDQIRSVTDKPIRFLVNTHFHADHTGGNPVFNKLAEIVAHRSVRPRLLEYPETVRRTFPDRVKAVEAELAGLKDPTDPYRLALEKDVDILRFFIRFAEAFKPEIAAPPEVTYSAELQLWLGDQDVEIFHVAPGHTDGDSIVFFRREKVLHMGDLFFNGMYPFIDAWGGGTWGGTIESVDQALARVPPDTKVIAGHGPTTDVATLRRYRAFLSDLRDEVARAVKAGESKADAVRAITMPQYPEITAAFRTLGNDVEVIYDEIKPARK